MTESMDTPEVKYFCLY